MKKLFKLGIGLIAVLSLSAEPSRAAFPLKQQTALSTESTTSSAASLSNVSRDAQEVHVSAAQAQQKTNAKSAQIPKGLYILLSFFWLGWLAMGINSDWDGYDWLISLLLYFLFWLPGFIYSIVKMKNYY